MVLSRRVAVNDVRKVCRLVRDVRWASRVGKLRWMFCGGIRDIRTREARLADRRVRVDAAVERSNRWVT